MEEIFFSITYPPIPITKVGPVFLSLHGVFAAIGFYFGAFLVQDFLPYLHNGMRIQGMDSAMFLH